MCMSYSAMKESTWLRAIKAGFYATWPMLTATAVIIFPRVTKEPVNDHDTHMIHTPSQQLRDISANIEDITTHVHRPDRKISHCLQSGQQVHNGSIWDRWKSHTGWTYEKQDLRWNMQGIQKIMQWLNNNGMKIKKHILNNEAMEEYLRTIHRKSWL